MAFILFVDDDSLTLQLMTRMVQMLGHEVVCDPSPRRALEWASQNQPGLILVDLNMMEMSGIQFVQALRQRPETCNLPVLIFSASRDAEDLEKALQVGANGYLFKPLNFDDLKNSIRQHVR
jgi:CheY-like chemotaxis protein